jgi:hypothetical protein
LEFYDANNVILAQIKPITSTNRYHAIAIGDTSVQGSSSYIAPNGQPQWIDVRLSVGTEITVELYVEGVLQTAATAANTGGKSKPPHVLFANTALHGSASTRTWYYAHIAVLDGVSTIGRRFVRRSPNAIASFNQMVGSIDALKDSDIATRVASTAAAQRMSFSLTGPTGPAPPLTVPVLAPKAIYSSWAVNPADSSAWASLTLPGEVGIVSA